MKTYQVEYKEYATDKVAWFIRNDFKSALAKAEELIKEYAAKWTRHNACSGVVRHMDTVFDLYNEGHITLEPVDAP